MKPLNTHVQKICFQFFRVCHLFFFLHPSCKGSLQKKNVKFTVRLTVFWWTVYFLRGGMLGMIGTPFRPSFKVGRSFKTQCQDEVRTYSAGTHILKVVKWG